MSVCSSRRIRRRLLKSVLTVTFVPAIAHAATNSTWTFDGDSGWNAASNWSAGIPNGIDSTATFGGAITNDHTVTQNLIGLTVGAIDFNNVKSYTISGNSLALDVTSGSGSITAEQGAHTISTIIALTDPLSYTGTGSAAVTLSGIISGNNGITVNGGNLTLAGSQQNTYSGNTTVSAGTLSADKPAGFNAVPPGTTLTIGAGTAGPQNADFAIVNGNNFGAGEAVVINGSGAFDDHDTAVNVTSLTMTGGVINQPRVFLMGNVATNASSDSATINSDSNSIFDLGNTTRVFTVADGAAGQDLVINAPVSRGTIVKNGAGTMVFNSTANNYTGSTTVNAGTLVVGASLITSGAWTLQVSGRAELAQNGGTVLKTNSVSVLGATCQFDVKDNKMILHSQGVGTWNGSAYLNGVTTYLASGYNHGAWDGSGIITSMTAANAQHHLTTLAVATAAQANKTTFAGQSVTPTDTLIMYTYNGDTNLDGRINADDYFQIDSHYNKTDNASKSYFNGDFNYDGQINGDDYALIDAAFAAQDAPFSTAPTLAGASAVPEPTMLSLTACALAFLTRRRRSHGGSKCQ